MADAQINNFVTRVRLNSAQVIDAYNTIRALRDEYTKRGLSAEIIQAELDGENLDVTGEEIVNVMVTADEWRNWFDAGNGTNLYKVKP